jgi:hypothetical protein
MCILPQLITIAKGIAKIPAGYRSITDVMLPVVQALLLDPSPEVSEASAASLANLIELLTNDDRGNYVLTIVLSKDKSILGQSWRTTKMWRTG